jgi:hypothetical protein
MWPIWTVKKKTTNAFFAGLPNYLPKDSMNVILCLCTTTLCNAYRKGKAAVLLPIVYHGTKRN